jgi:hypothetical protein
MKRIVVFIFLTSVLLPRCEKHSVGKQSNDGHAILHYDTSKTVIFSWDSLKHSFTGTTHPQATLSQGEFNLLDSLISVAVGEYHKELNFPKEHKEFEIDLKGRDYKRQLIVDINSDGDKIVRANYFCNTSDDLWRSKEFKVEDGASCYFSLHVNLTRKAHFHLIVNGSG